MTSAPLRDTDLAAGELEQQLDRLWATPKSFWGWLTTVDHKVIGRRYVITALIFLLLGGLAALVMRLQLSRPDNTVVGPDTYNQLFTMHGSTMMFLFAVPVMETMAVYLVPLMLGTRAVAFPRLNAFSYWVYLFAGRCCGSRSSSIAAPTMAGSTMCRCPDRNMASANVPTSGHR